MIDPANFRRRRIRVVLAVCLLAVAGASFVLIYFYTTQSRSSKQDMGIQTNSVEMSTETRGESEDWYASLGTNVNKPTNIAGWTPIMWAASYNDTNQARTLIARGADVNARNCKEQTALMLAVMTGDESINSVRLLIETGADVNAKDRDGNTPLDYARAADNHEQLEVILKKAGAKPRADAEP